MNKKLLITAAILGILGIVLGAFAAHGLEKVLDKEAIDTFETGVRYQMYHALMLLFLGNTTVLNDKTKKKRDRGFSSPPDTPVMRITTFPIIITSSF